MMIDPDIPPATAGGQTTQLLHWMQSGLVSANMTTTIGGQKVYELTNPTNTRALASYIGPAPPNVSPNTHRYTQLLFETPDAATNGTSKAGNSSSVVDAMAVLTKFASVRSNFSAENVIKSAGVTVLAGNSFDVTATASNSQGIGAGDLTSIPGAAAAESAALASSTTGTTPNSAGKVEGGAIVAVFGALAAAIFML